MIGLVVPMNLDLWLQIQNAPNPPTALKERALLELRESYGYDEDQLELVETDPLFNQSVDFEYRKARKLATKKNKVPKTMKIEFQSLASKNRRHGPAAS